MLSSICVHPTNAQPLHFAMSNHQPFTVRAPLPRFFHPGNVLVAQIPPEEEKTITLAAEGMWT